MPSLTDGSVENAVPSKRPTKLYDGDGLFLLVSPHGGKWWRFRYRFQGKEKLISLGTYPKISLTEARSLKDNARQILKQGIDPSVVRNVEKAERKAAKIRAKAEIKHALGVSVRCMMDGYIELWKGGNIMRFSLDEARFIAKQLSNLVR